MWRMLVDIFGREVFADEIVEYNGSGVASVRLWINTVATDVPLYRIRVIWVVTK